MKPLKTLLFVIAVFILLAGTILVTPEAGVKVGEFSFHMPTFAELFSTEKTVYTDITDIVGNQLDIDSIEAMENIGDTAVQMAAAASYDQLVLHTHKLEMNEEVRISLTRFFEKLKAGKPTRIMHYGDSQLEGDRITANLRNKLQTKFGGSGIGLRPAVQPYDFVFSAVQTNSSNWLRFPIYGKVDSLVRHNRYGVAGAFSRFAPLVIDSVFRPVELREAELTIAKSNIGFAKTREYKLFRLFYGNSRSEVDMKLLSKGQLVQETVLPPSTDYGVVSVQLPPATDEITVKFSGYDSPDIYGIDLSDPAGVTVDNIALRGCSGTIFTQADYNHSTKMFKDLNPGLFILQFGGNVMPYTKDMKAVDNYGRWFANQIKRIKQSCPDAAVIVIGPSDMSTKVKDKYETYEFLPAVVEAMKKAALATGSAYWDMYTAMGGRNSMPSWVNANPQLAGPDYVHFTPKGSSLISNMFYNALILEYNNYLNNLK